MTLKDPTAVYLIALDVDGTTFSHQYPGVGEDLGAVPWLRAAVQGWDVKIMLWTMRSGDQLDAAAEWLTERGIPIYAVNKRPGQDRWTDSPKGHAQLYLDDRGLGTPRLASGDVDWRRYGPMLIAQLVKDLGAPVRPFDAWDFNEVSILVQPQPYRGQKLVTPHLVDQLTSRPPVFEQEKVWREAIAEGIQARSAFGEVKYGSVLTTHNGRDASRDAWQELLDALAYLQQMQMEQEDPDDSIKHEVPAALMKYLGAQIDRILYTLQ